MNLDLEALQRVVGQAVSFAGFVMDRLREAVLTLNGTL
jgi:hypothetical protein